jgi:hypothetical protein
MRARMSYRDVRINHLLVRSRNIQPHNIHPHGDLERPRTGYFGDPPMQVPPLNDRPYLGHEVLHSVNNAIRKPNSAMRLRATGGMENCELEISRYLEY